MQVVHRSFCIGSDERECHDEFCGQPNIMMINPGQTGEVLNQDSSSPFSHLL